MTAVNSQGETLSDHSSAHRGIVQPEASRDIVPDIRDVASQRVITPAMGRHAAGTYTVGWDGTREAGETAPAVGYVARLDPGRETRTGRPIRIR